MSAQYVDLTDIMTVLTWDTLAFLLEFKNAFLVAL